MSSFWKKTMSILGLAPAEELLDEEEEEDLYEEEQAQRREEPQSERTRAVTPSSPIRLFNQERRVVTDDEPIVPLKPPPVKAVGRPCVVTPRRFSDVQQIGDRFKASQPVIVNCEEADAEVTRRTVDFCSGLVYALDGTMERVAEKVYLLTPNAVEVPEDEKRKIRRLNAHRRH